MHNLDSADSASGLYVSGPPKSVIGKNALNAHHQELKNAVLQAGLALASSGANDFSETAWLQLVQAIRILSGRGGNANDISNGPTPKVKYGFDTGDAKSFTLTGVGLTATDLCFNNYFTSAGGSPASDTVVLDDGANFHDKIAIFHNFSIYSVTINTSPNSIIIEPGQCMAIYHTGSYWTPLTFPNTKALPQSTDYNFVKKVVNASYGVYARDSTPADVVSAGSSYEIIDDWVHFRIPRLTFATATGIISLGGAAGAALPTEIQCSVDSPSLQISNKINSETDFIVSSLDYVSHRLVLTGRTISASSPFTIPAQTVIWKKV